MPSRRLWICNSNGNSMLRPLSAQNMAAPRSPRHRQSKRPVLLRRTGLFGTPDAIRTHGLRSRSPTLYPAELRAHIQLRAKPEKRLEPGRIGRRQTPRSGGEAERSGADLLFSPAGSPENGVFTGCARRSIQLSYGRIFSCGQSPKNGLSRAASDADRRRGAAERRSEAELTYYFPLRGPRKTAFSRGARDARSS